jgi:hypothetical protein
MAHFQLKVAPGAMFLRWNCDDSARPLWWKRTAIPAFRWSLRAAAGRVWHFCRVAEPTRQEKSAGKIGAFSNP